MSYFSGILLEVSIKYNTLNNRFFGRGVIYSFHAHNWSFNEI